MNAVDATALTWIQGALTLDAAAFATFTRAANASGLALLTLFAGGLSHAVGQSVALFANRVAPWRFAASLATGSLTFTASVLIWSAGVYITARLLLQYDVPVWDVLRVVGLAHAPRMFGFLTFTPYFGSGIGVLLTLWTYLALSVGVRSAFGLGQLEALATMGAAWILSEIAGRTLGRPAAAGLRWLRSRWLPHETRPVPS